MNESWRQLFLPQSEEAALLRTELLYRAATDYAEAGWWKEAAECWTELGRHDQAAESYAQSGNLAEAAKSWMHRRDYARALPLYQAWEQRLPREDHLHRIEALLGQALCHWFGMQQPSRKRGISLEAGQDAYQQARALLEAEGQRDVLKEAQGWRLLGAYGTLLGRYDLAQEGFERALERLETGQASVEKTAASQEYDQTCRAYLETARAHSDRLLCQVLEERLGAGLSRVSSSSEEAL